MGEELVAFGTKVGAGGAMNRLCVEEVVDVAKDKDVALLTPERLLCLNGLQKNIFIGRGVIVAFGMERQISNGWQT